MKVITLDDNVFYLVPRSFPGLMESLVLYVENEEDLTLVELSFEWGVEDQLIKINVLNPEVLNTSADYDITILDDYSNIIYKGKIKRLGNNTDVQNFDPQDRWT